MDVANIVSHPLDIAYIKENFVCLEFLCAVANRDAAQVREEIARGERPGVAYTLSDGTQWVSKDYFDLENDRSRFTKRARVEGVRLETYLSEEELEELWCTYLTGVYAVCLHRATPENIVRKSVLVETIEALASLPQEEDPAWLTSLQRAVDELDRLERPFSPVFDREFFGRPPTRDSHITAMRHRFPAIRRDSRVSDS